MANVHGNDYAKAERDADQWAGDNPPLVICVVEDFTRKEFLTMHEADALAYVTGHDAEIQYTAMTVKGAS